MSQLRIDFVIAGEPKSGTTALAQFLSQHPGICLSNPKEPGYFATDLRAESDAFHGKPKHFLIRTSQDYKRCFSHCTKGQLRGDASTCYTYSETAARNIHAHNPAAKILIMIREPVDFLHSLHMQYVNEMTENQTDFEAALSLEADRKQGRRLPPKARCPSYHFYSERIKYADHIRRYLDIFGRDQVMVIANEDFWDDNAAIYARVVDFLGVNDDVGIVSINFGVVHGSRQHRSTWINRLANAEWLKFAVYRLLGPQLYTNLQKQVVETVLFKKASRKHMDSKLRRKLARQATPEVRKLDVLLNSDFASTWGYE